MYEKISADYGKIFKFNQVVVDFMNSYAAPNSNILDIGCGRGRYTDALEKLGHKAIGIDPDKKSIEEGKELYPGVELVNSDLFGYKTDSRFNLIFCIGNAISHIPPQDISPFVDRVYSLLDEGGVWVFHTINWDFVLKQKEYDFQVLRAEGMTFKRWYRNITEESVDFETSLITENGEEIKNEIKLFPLTEKKIVSTHNSFKLESLFTDYKKTPFEGNNISKIYIFKK